MSKIQKEFKYDSRYLVAGNIKKYLVNEGSMENEEITMLFDSFFYLKNPDFINKLLNPNKITLLHDFISVIEYSDIDYYERKGDIEDVIEDWEKLLLGYKIYFKKENYLTVDDDNYDDIVKYKDYLTQLIYDDAIIYTVDEVFQLLFSDRTFCMEFNKLIAQRIHELTTKKYPKLLSSKGIIKRKKKFPEWVQRAIFYRERGKCAICQKDISGILSTNFSKAIDHIVPLKLGGCNDITNLQLLCSECNSTKSGTIIKTSDYYPRYF